MIWPLAAQVAGGFLFGNGAFLLFPNQGGGALLPGSMFEHEDRRHIWGRFE
ncbi:hypothetical protein NIT7645_01998 [Phaeobacter italicus]|nr:hypothetical protein NIT7645_01998 [Phaeobacter italicus]SFH63270.1 hypothetical protein SAMN04488019_1238 [Phaeobacter italicus]